MIDKLYKCEMCPHECGINRNNNQVGFCKANNNVKIALVSLHKFEEPCISGENGSGTIFFSNCNLNCKYCQNYEISQLGKGKEITIERLAEILIEQQERNAENINLVTPTIYIYQIIEAIKIARRAGLVIPIVYNSNGYENVETLKLLEGYIDIYLPDFKYYDEKLGVKYSGIYNYPNIAKETIKEMYRQVGTPEIDGNGMMKRGTMVRHLILPGYLENTKQVLKWIKDTFEDKIYISIMAQYFPTYKAKEDSTLNRKLTQEEYDEIENYLFGLDLENGYIQDLGTHEEEYVPEFNFENI